MGKQEEIVKNAVSLYRGLNEVRNSTEAMMPKVLMIENIVCGELVKEGLYPSRTECIMKISEKVIREDLP